MPLRPPLWVVKVGGSLYELPDLGARLRDYLTSKVPPQAVTLLVPGGGAAADAVRALDTRHRLGEEQAHFLALRALSLNAHFLACLLGDYLRENWAILDSYSFLEADECRTGQALVPHCWDATSDSVAARAAVVLQAERLVLLKSMTIPAELSWDEAGQRGLVDPVFPHILRQATSPLEVIAVNLRDP